MTRSLGTILTALSLVAGVPLAGQTAEVTSRIEQLERQMLEMQNELKALRAEQAQEAQETKRKTSIIASEMDKLKTSLTIPEFKPLDQEDRQYGFGPAASKVYGVERGLSLGGYGEAFYSKFVGDKTRNDRDTADFLRFVLYAGYKFTDRLIFNTEIEFEHGSTGSTESSGNGSVSVEFAYLDFLMRDWANFRAGLLLVPLGIVNQLHEPVFFHGVARPEIEQRIIPTTWRENGVGIFGELYEGLEYQLYAINGFNAKGFRDNGFRGGRQQGNRALAEDIAVAGRLEYSPLPSLTFGVAGYTGDAGQDQMVDGVEFPNAHTTIWETHGIYRAYGLELRGLFAMSFLDDAAELTEALRQIGELSANRTVAKQMLGGYIELAYNILPLLFPGTEQALSPFVRFSYLDLQHDVPSGAGFNRNGNARFRIWTPGFSYKPHPNVVLKVDYRNFNPMKGKRAQEVNFGMGFVF